SLCCCMLCFFFFQAEDGIRDPLVTGVQTCALPILRGKAFEEDLVVADLNVDAVARARMAHGRKKWLAGRAAGAVERVVISEPYVPKKRARTVVAGAVPLDPLEEVYRGLVLGVRDYVGKNGFRRFVIGLSGGIDCALAA